MASRKLESAAKIAAPLIRKHEGLRLTTYTDPVGVPTIGYGHTGSAAYGGNTITPGEANTLLRMDIAEAQKPLRNYPNLNKNQLAALTSFIFNVGARRFYSSTLKRKIEAEDFEGAAEEFPRWKYGTIGGQKRVLPGLVTRREEEKKLFETDPQKKN